jgi:hypothetical protein
VVPGFANLSAGVPWNGMDRLPRLFRWRVEPGSSGEWNVTFRLMVVLKA